MRKEPGKGRRRGSVAVGVLLLAIGVGYSSGSAKSAVAAHSGTSALTSIKVDMSFPYAASQWNCLYDYGKTKGFFAKHGVDPTFDALVGSVALINQVATGAVDIGTSAAIANVIQAVSAGAPVKLVGVQERNSPNAVISLSTKPITRPRDLIGKTIAYSPSSLSGLSLQLLLSTYNLSASQVHVASVLPAAYASALASGTIDGYVSYPSSSVPNTEKLGGKPVVMLLRNFRVNPVPADGYIASDAFISAHPGAVKGFLAGAYDTWAYLAKHPGAATAAGQACASQHVGIDPALAAEQIKLVLEANAKQLKAPDFMSIPLIGLRAQISLLEQANQLSKPQPLSAYYTTALLPKANKPAPKHKKHKTR
jgi:NitT/TauT family transport system substrate-binding protein